MSGFPLRSRGYFLRSRGYLGDIQGSATRRQGYFFRRQGSARRSRGYVGQMQGYFLRSRGFISRNRGYVDGIRGYVSRSEGFIRDNYGFYSAYNLECAPQNLHGTAYLSIFYTLSAENPVYLEFWRILPELKRTLGTVLCARVFREGAENCARGGRAPASMAVSINLGTNAKR